MEQFIYVLKAVRPAMLTDGPTASEAATIERHNAHLDRMAKSGAVLLAGRTQNTDRSAFGIIILQAESESRAREMMRSDPFIADGVAEGVLYPYKISYLSKALTVSP